MRDLLDLDRYPIDQPSSPRYPDLVATCRRELELNGMFNLDGFVRPTAIARAAEEVRRRSGEAFTHQRRHNIYFKKQIDGLAPEHRALTLFDTTHHTLCDDQLQGTIAHRIYEFAALPAFLAAVLNKPALYAMEDSLARANVIEYRPGETLNWHFDRSEFTVTLLIQPASAGGEFEYRSNLRTNDDPNYEGVAGFLSGADPSVRINPLAAGTLNVFAGKNTLHRVSKVRGEQSRLVAVYSYYERPGVMFSDEERVGFYGRDH